jgi:acyl-coenzyme A synthetase/AMP-(fatty) acid ligase
MRKDLIWHSSTYTPPDSKKIFESLPKALADVALQYPDSPAVIWERKIYTFHDLISRIAGLSDEINEIGQHTSGPIALLQSEGLDAIAAWFACILSGRPFILLEPDSPPARLINLLKTAGCKLAILDEHTSNLLTDLPEIIQFVSKGRYGTLKQGKGLHLEDPAMIFPTSGSTGDPKLIVYSSITIQVKVQSSIQLMSVPRGEARVMIAGSHSNYGFLHHALVFLLSGNAVCLANIKTLGFGSILNGITNLGVRHVRFTPSLFRKLAILPKAQKVLGLLEAVRFSGEPLLENDLKLAQVILNSNCLVQNIYGSTESTLFIWSSINTNSFDKTHSVPIGKIYPLSSYAIKPLENKHMDNSTGELLIKSKFHALGDLIEGEIDKARFPLIEGSLDERIYATGDIVNQLPNGDLLHLGRISRMVKIRGNRVYLTEIEQQLSSIPGVLKGAVIDYLEQDNVVIYGFITTQSPLVSSDDVRRKLAAQLPDFMIPKNIEILTQIPLLPNGKVDYQTLSKLISKSESLEHLKKPISDSDRLIQVWDSLLWYGAHKHDLDFFSLGGDSLSFMVLLIELEQNFGKSLTPEEIRTQCTLLNLTDILSIDGPSTEPTLNYKSLKFSKIWNSNGHSKGVALSMPGVGGSSPAYPFHQAKYFENYDIWIIEFPIKDGNLLDEDRWWKAALEIVQAIQEGEIPIPNVVFGFSFGGGLAWLVSRMLAGTHFSPKFVVMVDAPPLHRRRKLRHRSFINLLQNTSNVEMPAIIHLRRSPIGQVDASHKNKQEWSPSDKIRKVIDLPTFNHLDMINREILELPKESILAFLDGSDLDFNWTSIKEPPNILGCHFFYALNGNEFSFQMVMNESVKGTDIWDIDYFINLVILNYARDHKIKSEELIQIALKKWPYSRILHFLHFRIRRNFTMLFSENVPKIYPTTIASVEIKLALIAKNHVQPLPLPVRQIGMAFDVASALLYSRYIKWKYNSSVD